MKKQLIYLLMATLLFASACNKDEEYENPTISFNQTEGFTYQGVTMKVGEFITVGITASTQSDVNLSSFNYTIMADENETSVDSGINVAAFTWVKIIEKGIADEETWTFTVSDKDGRSSELVLVLTKDASSSYGAITRYTDIVLGAQDNTNASFFAFEDGTTLTLGNAFANSEKVQLVYFFDEVGTDKNTLASPGANFDEDVFAGQYSINDWTTKKETRYVSKTINEDEFNLAANDSLILENTFEFSSGKRKAKELSVGDSYAFVSEDNYKGIFIVKAIDGEAAGTITIDIIVSE